MKGKVYKFDASKEALGRLATKVAVILRGKNSATFSPNNPDLSVKVTVYNTDNLKVTGNKMEDKIYYHHSGYPGGIKARSLKDYMVRDSREVFRKAVYGMLPKNKLRDKLISRLVLVRGALTEK